MVLGVPILQNPKHALQKIAGDINRLRWGKYYVCDGSNLDIEAHLHEAAQWLVRAQDAGADQGVSYGARFGGDFYASYPETTGYIISTFPDYLDKSFDQLIATLSSGLPRVRNEEGAHGQGAKPRATPPYVAAYASG